VCLVADVSTHISAGSEFVYPLLTRSDNKEFQEIGGRNER